MHFMVCKGKEIPHEYLTTRSRVKSTQVVRAVLLTRKGIYYYFFLFTETITA